MPIVANDPLAVVAPEIARKVSDLLASSIVRGTLTGYNSGFRSLCEFCAPLGLLALPASSVTLVAWMHHLTHKPKPVKPKSVKKYLSGVRFFHITNGHAWTMSDDPVLHMAKRALARRFPEAPQRLKVPISVGLLWRMCLSIPGFPFPESMLFDDVLWVTASCIMLLGALRGGELTRVKGTSRPVLLGQDIFLFNIRELDGSVSSGVKILVRAPKTEPGAAFQEAFAVDASGSFPLNPSFWLSAYRRAAGALGLRVLDTYPAFKDARGATLSRDYMVDRANTLRNATGACVRDVDGSAVPFLAASWRAGFVLSARAAGMSEFLIRKAGRWASAGGPAPYTFTSMTEFRSAALAMTTAASLTQLSAVFDVGSFNSACIFEHA